MNLFLEFQVGPYTASFGVVLVWLLVVLFTIVIHKLIQKHLKRYLKRAKLEIKGTRITLLRILNQLLYVVAFIVAFQAFRIKNDKISLSEFMSYNIIPEFNGFTLSFLDVIIIIIIFTASRFVINIFRLYIANRFKDNPDFDEGTRYVYVQLENSLFFGNLKATL